MLQRGVAGARHGSIYTLFLSNTCEADGGETSADKTETSGRIERIPQKRM